MIQPTDGIHSIETARSAATDKLDLIGKSSPSSTVGKALFGDEKQIRLCVRGFAKPILLTLKDGILLGRRSLNMEKLSIILLDNYGAVEAGVSRKHAALIFDEQLIKVADLDSANGTFLNGQRLVPHQPRILRDGDELRLGNLFIQVYFG